MEDGPPGNSLKATETGDPPGHADGGEPSLGPSAALLRVVIGDRIPTGPLGPDTISAAVLALPIQRATEALVQHAKKCKDVRCPHVPPPLQAYRRADAIRKARDKVHKVLWTHANHELVTWVRKQVLAEYSQLADEISTGKLLIGSRLGDVLNELRPNGLNLLAAVLWAGEFKAPGTETLFRNLVPLVEGGPSFRLPSDRVAPPAVRRVISLRANLRRSEKDLEQATRAAVQAKHDLERKERALERSKRELEESQLSYREVADELDRVQRRLREKEDESRRLERDAEKTARVNANLRRELRQLQDEQRELEVGRSDLARQVAAERREVENLKLRIAAAPRGSDAAIAFLREEEERIRRDRTILSGGARARADQEWTAYRKLERAFLEGLPRIPRTTPAQDPAKEFSTTGYSRRLTRGWQELLSARAGQVSDTRRLRNQTKRI